MKGFAVAVGVLAIPLVIVVLFAVLFAAPAIEQHKKEQQQKEQESGNAGGGLSTKVPKKYRTPIRKAAKRCNEVTPPLLAAQLDQETGFTATSGGSAVTSSAGAKGPAQFLPETWKRFKTDGDGDGKKSITSVPDAVAGQGKYMCQIGKKIHQAKKKKKVHGSGHKLMLAAYNAGTGAVMKSGGVPPTGEPAEYAEAISKKVSKYEGSSADDAPVKGGSLQAKAIKHAHKELGTPYSFGGGTPKKPTVGKTHPAGWDCSSYVQMAYYRASHGKIDLQPPTQTQMHSSDFKKVTGRTKSLSKHKLKPGDVIFVDTDGNWGHVVMYEGKGKIVEEPHTGAKSRVKPLSEYSDKDKTVRRVTT